MDTKKIGSFIAQRRKALDMTQKQLAEMLGMSDKSVSKWERGVCLPDVSIYTQLCEILGISLNEFFAGEEIKSDNIESVSEENLIKVSKASKNKQKTLKRVILVVTAMLLVVAVAFASFLWGPFWPTSYIKDLSNTKEVENMSTISGPEGVYAFEYVKTDEYKELEFYLSVYKEGKRVEKSTLMGINFEALGAPKRGKIVVVPDLDHSMVKLIAICENGSYSTDFEVLEDAKDPYIYGRIADHLEGKKDIKNNEEKGLVAIYYGADGIRSGAIESIGGKTEPMKNDYTYYISYKFKD